MYHDSVIEKCESTLSAAEHSPMQKNQHEPGVDFWADVASFGEDEPLPAFGAGPCMSTANNNGFQLPSHVTKKLARQQRRTKQTTGTKQVVGSRPVDTSARSAALQTVPRPIVAFVGRLHTDTTAENLEQHLTDMDIRGTRCTKLEAKDGRVLNTAASVFLVTLPTKICSTMRPPASWL